MAAAYLPLRRLKDGAYCERFTAADAWPKGVVTVTRTGRGAESVGAWTLI
jgi:hypothetical protein